MTVVTELVTGISIDTLVLIVIACELGFIYVKMANKD